MKLKKLLNMFNPDTAIAIRTVTEKQNNTVPMIYGLVKDIPLNKNAIETVVVFPDYNECAYVTLGNMKVTQISEICSMDYCKYMSLAATMLFGGLSIICITVSDNPQDYSNNPDVKMQDSFFISIAEELKAIREERMDTKPLFQ